MTWRLVLGTAGVGALGIGCGGVTIAEDEAASGGTSGGGESASSSTGSTSTSSTSSTSSGGPASCSASSECGKNEFCDDAKGACGIGTCAPRPEGCFADCPGACGCDGAFYCNECSAQAAGVDASSSGGCENPDAEYSAFFYIGQVDHLTIRKADPVRDVCLQVYLMAPARPPAGFDLTAPRPFAYESAVISHAASDCIGMGGWSGEVEYAIGAKGAVTWQGQGYPCELDIDATLQFSAQAPWVNAVESMNATNIPVDGCM